MVMTNSLETKKKIQENNDAIRELNSQISRLRSIIDDRLKLGDELATQEILEFIKENELKSVSLIVGFSGKLTVFEGDGFPYTGKKMMTTATGTGKKEAIIEELSKYASDYKKVKHTKDDDDGLYLVEISVFYFN